RQVAVRAQVEQTLGRQQLDHFAHGHAAAVAAGATRVGDQLISVDPDGVVALRHLDRAVGDVGGHAGRSVEAVKARARAPGAADDVVVLVAAAPGEHAPDPDPGSSA